MVQYKYSCVSLAHTCKQQNYHFYEGSDNILWCVMQHTKILM